MPTTLENAPPPHGLCLSERIAARRWPLSATWGTWLRKGTMASTFSGSRKYTRSKPSSCPRCRSGSLFRWEKDAN